jgi:hypothetical protein
MRLELKSKMSNEDWGDQNPIVIVEGLAEKSTSIHSTKYLYLKTLNA